MPDVSESVEYAHPSTLNHVKECVPSVGFGYHPNLRSRVHNNSKSKSTVK